MRAELRDRLLHIMRAGRWPAASEQTEPPAVADLTFKDQQKLPVAPVAHVAGANSETRYRSGYRFRYRSKILQDIENQSITAPLQVLQVKSTESPDFVFNGATGVFRPVSGPVAPVAAEPELATGKQLKGSAEPDVADTSTKLWCIECGKFPEQLPDGATFRHGVSFYCARCWPKNSNSETPKFWRS